MDIDAETVLKLIALGEGTVGAEGIFSYQVSLQNESQVRKTPGKLSITRHVSIVSGEKHEYAIVSFTPLPEAKP